MKTLKELEGETKEYRTGVIDPVTKIYWTLNSEIILKLAMKNSSEGNEILDVGCGVGSYLVGLSKEGRICYGVDPLWETSLVKAHEKADVEGSNVQLFRAFGEILPFKGEVFDEILCISTLQHVNDQYKTLQEIKRLLKEKGLLLVSVPQTIRKPTFKRLGVYTMHFNLRILINMLNECGFKVIETKGCGFFPPFTSKILNYCYPLLGDKITKRIIIFLDIFAKLVPKYASSIIVLCEVNK